MTRGQRRTAKLLLAAGVAFVLLVVGLLVIEGFGVASGDEATISELVWIAWATQPWVIWLVSVVVIGVLAFLAGHFFAQKASVYEEIRAKRLPRWPMDEGERAALERAYREHAEKGGN